MNNEEEKILSWMSDEESRQLYSNRVKFQNTYDYRYIQDSIDEFVPLYRDRKWLYLSDRLKEILSSYKRVIVSGIGQKGKALIVLLRQNGYDNISAVDNNVTGTIHISEGISIETHTPQSADYNDACVLVSLSSRSVAEQIKTQLIACGCDESKVYLLDDYVCPAVHDKDHEYFDESIIHFGENETFVDCGALDMETSVFFTERCLDAGVRGLTIHAFEPESNNYQRCMGNLEYFQSHSVNTYIYKKGVWNENKSLGFVSGLGDASKVSDTGTDETIEVVALDSVIDERVTFIKMDIEGAELNALKGAKRLISTYRPKLAICLYHKPEDIITIPEFVKSLIPDYKLYVRHYSNNTGEFVLYAV